MGLTGRSLRNLREETIKGLTGRLKQGLYPFRAPIGYLDNGRGQPKTPCSEKAPLVREAFILYSTGQHSIRSLQIEVNGRGLRNHAGQPLSLHGIETILGNTFYCGVIAIKRTGATYKGIHEPLIDAKTFARVQDVKAGKAGKKTTRHNHLYRGLFRCGLCEGPMSPERQKGCVYYRCQTPDCVTKTIREDQIDEVVQEKLGSLELCQEQTKKLRRDWLAWIEGDERNRQIRSLELRIGQSRERLDRLTDLLIDGTIGKDDYHDRKRNLTLKLVELEETHRDTTKNHLSPVSMEKYLELMNSLTELHILAKPADKRCMVENCFSNRLVVNKNVELQPSDWLQIRKISELTPLVTQIDPLLELLSFREISRAGETRVPQRKFNLVNQFPNDHGNE